MSIIEDFLVGKMDIHSFILLFQNNDTLKDELRKLIPTDAIGNPAHPIWKNIGYSALSGDGFDFVKSLKRICRFDERIGDNLNIWSSIWAVYRYHFPNTPVTTKYKDVFGLYIDAVGDCFRGPEVSKFVEQIIVDTLSVSPKTKRIKEAKEKVRTAFHVTDRTRPYWIQGPEWPMGKNSPMRYVKRTRKGEQVDYHFVDVDTNETRIVTQYY